MIRSISFPCVVSLSGEYKVLGLNTSLVKRYTVLIARGEQVRRLPILHWAASAASVQICKPRHYNI